MQKIFFQVHPFFSGNCIVMNTYITMLLLHLIVFWDMIRLLERRNCKISPTFLCHLPTNQVATVEDSLKVEKKIP